MFRISSVAPFLLFEISYLWYTLAGTFIALAVGIVVSYITGFNDPKDVHKDLLTPIIHNFLPKHKKKVKVAEKKKKTIKYTIKTKFIIKTINLLVHLITLKHFYFMQEQNELKSRTIS